MTKRKKAAWPRILLAVLIFAIAAVILSVGTVDFGARAENEAVASAKRAIERAAVLCYATEGFYPPGLDYIEANYGVQVDESRYVVNYDVFAKNVMPVVTVKPRSKGK